MANPTPNRARAGHAHFPARRQENGTTYSAPGRDLAQTISRAAGCLSCLLEHSTFRRRKGRLLAAVPVYHHLHPTYSRLDELKEVSPSVVSLVSHIHIRNWRTPYLDWQEGLSHTHFPGSEV